MEVEQNHMVMSGRYGEQEGDGCHSRMVMSWRREVREAGKRRSFFFNLFLIESHQFVLLI